MTLSAFYHLKNIAFNIVLTQAVFQIVDINDKISDKDKDDK